MLFKGGFFHNTLAVMITIEIEQEEDGRFLAEGSSLPGVLAYGQTREEAVTIQALALCVLAEQLEHGEVTLELISVSLRELSLF